MTPRFIALAIASLLFVGVACRTKTEAALAASAAVTAASASHASHASHAPQAPHDSLDQRTPLPLLPMMAHHQKQNMRDHLEAVQQITAAVARSDFDAVATAAKRIGYSEQMGRMCQHMGSGAPGFTELALEFHHRADTIATAAQSRNSAAVSAALAETLASCTNCHARFKQQIVDEATWAALPRR